MVKKIGVSAILVGGVLDILDWLGAGMVPVIGDVIDLVGIAYFWRLLGPMALVGLIELVPVLDIAPTWTALGFLAYMRGEMK
ncbi:MAG: hypothetical protein QXQ70_03125 [Candidatus Caldarchaeum sp.]